MNLISSPTGPVAFLLGSAGLALCLACHAPAYDSANLISSIATNSQPAGATLAWTQFTDPKENAFTVDVPRGWTVHGGLLRLGYSDERPMVDIQSPDGRIDVRLGDVAVPTYVTPVQFHAREGEVYDLGAQARMIVARYRTGPEYAVLYAQARFSDTCKNPQSDTSAAAFTVADYLPVPTSPSQSSSGQIVYHCTGVSGPLVAFAYAKTVQTQAIWQAPTIASFLAPPDKVALARTILTHCAESFRLNPEWLEYQKRMDAEGLQYQRQRQQGRMMQLQQQQQQFEAKMRAMQQQMNAFEAHQQSERDQFEKMDDVINGVTPTTNPLTGENRKVWTGTQDNYWVNGVGQVVNSHDAPAAGWQQLQTH